MLPRFRSVWAALTAVALCAGALRAEDAGLKKGTPDLKSAGPLAFGPHGLLLVGDPQGAAKQGWEPNPAVPLFAGHLRIWQNLPVGETAQHP